MDLSILSRDTRHMTLMDETSSPAGLSRDLEEFQIQVDLARRNPWHGGDVVAPEYARFLSSLAARPVGATVAPPSNPWRDSLDQLG